MVANEKRSRLLLEAMQWFFCDRDFEKEVQVRFQNRIGVEVLIRDYIKRLDMALQQLTGDYEKEKKRSLLDYWPNLLQQLKIRNSKNKKKTKETLKLLHNCFEEANSETHVGDTLAQLLRKDFKNGIRIFMGWVAEADSPEKIWLQFISHEVTDATQNTRRDHHYLYLLLEAIYRSQSDESIYTTVSKWFEDQLRSATRKFQVKRSMENDLKWYLETISRSPDMKEKIYLLAKSLGFNSHEHRQNAHFYSLQVLLATQEKLLPEVLHWGIEGEDSGCVDMTLQLGSKDQTPKEFKLCGKPLKMALIWAVNNSKELAGPNDKPLLQIESHPDLFFELQQTLKDLGMPLKLLFRDAVSGIVFAPLRHTEAVVQKWEPRKERFLGNEWYHLKPFDSEKNHWDFSRPSGVKVDDWIVDENIFHAYLSDWNGIRDQWDLVCAAFWTVIFVGLGESESCFEGFGKGSNLKLNEAVEILGNKQKRFSEAPVVLWQHEERKSEFSRQWEFSRVEEDLNAFCP